MTKDQGHANDQTPKPNKDQTPSRPTDTRPGAMPSKERGGSPMPPSKQAPGSAHVPGGEKSP